MEQQEYLLVGGAKDGERVQLSHPPKETILFKIPVDGSPIRKGSAWDFRSIEYKVERYFLLEISLSPRRGKGEFGQLEQHCETLLFYAHESLNGDGLTHPDFSGRSRADIAFIWMLAKYSRPSSTKPLEDILRATHGLNPNDPKALLDAVSEIVEIARSSLREPLHPDREFRDRQSWVKEFAEFSAA